MFDQISALSRHMSLNNQYGMGVGLILLSIGSFTYAESARQVDNLQPKTTQQQIGYSLGYEFGEYLAELKHRNTEVALETVLQGIIDARQGAQPQLTKEQMHTVLNELKQSSLVNDKLNSVNTQIRKQPARTGRHMDDYAKLNAKRDGVVVLPSGVQYEILQKGKGDKVKATDTVTVNYEGTLTNGVVFDGTYKDGKPVHLVLDEVAVPGLKEALLQMQVGDKWRVVIPPALGFANSGNNLLRRRDLIYEIELIGLNMDKETESSRPGPEK